MLYIHILNGTTMPTKKKEKKEEKKEEKKNLPPWLKKKK
jgi:hypothetical protein